jgi:hypothetical protein
MLQDTGVKRSVRGITCRILVDENGQHYADLPDRLKRQGANWMLSGGECSSLLPVNPLTDEEKQNSKESHNG